MATLVEGFQRSRPLGLTVIPGGALTNRQLRGWAGISASRAVNATSKSTPCATDSSGTGSGTGA